MKTAAKRKPLQSRPPRTKHGQQVNRLTPFEAYLSQRTWCLPNSLMNILQLFLSHSQSFDAQARLGQGGSSGGWRFHKKTSRFHLRGSARRGPDPTLVQVSRNRRNKVSGNRKTTKSFQYGKCQKQENNKIPWTLSVFKGFCLFLLSLLHLSGHFPFPHLTARAVFQHGRQIQDAGAE